MKKNLFLFPLVVIFLLAPKLVGASAPVIINEVAWMGTTESLNNEWVELKNISDNEVNLANWQLISADGKDIVITFAENDKIASNGFYLLERKMADGNSTFANFIYNGILSNESTATKQEGLNLFDASHNLIDAALANSGTNGKKWPAGDNTKKLTMERTENGSWQNSQNPGGTPGQVNSVLTDSPTSSPSSSPSPSPSPSFSPLTSPLPATSATPSFSPSISPENTENGSWQYSNDIFINEFLPNPPTNEKEWVELYNAGEEPVNLTNWQIANGKDNTQTIPENTKIEAKSFLIITFNGYFLNNDGGQIKLLWPDEQILHSISYGKADKNFSCARFNNKWLWTNQPTPGEVNKKSGGGSSAQTPAPTAKIELAALEETVSAPIQSLKSNNSGSAAAPNTTLADSFQSPDKPGAANDSINFSAAAASQLPTQSNTTKTFFALLLVVAASLAVGGFFVYFRRKSRIDN